MMKKSISTPSLFLGSLVGSTGFGGNTQGIGGRYEQVAEDDYETDDDDDDDDGST